MDLWNMCDFVESQIIVVSRTNKISSLKQNCTS